MADSRNSVLTLIASVLAVAQASPFVNLDFEQSTVLPSDGSVVSTAAAFPGWTARFGSSTSSSVYHDYEGAGEPIVAVYDKKVEGPNYILLQGKYMAYVAPGTPNAPTSLSQIGDIPPGTQFLTMLTDGGEGPPVVRLNGTVIPMVFLSGIHGNGRIATFGGEISAFAGQTAELRLEATDFFDHASGRHSFDDIRFSSQIPEPSFLFPIAVAGNFLRRRK